MDDRRHRTYRYCVDPCHRVNPTQEERAKARRAVSRVETIATDGSISLVRVRILTGRWGSGW